ncbi:MAG: DUF1566 domain-containing protein [Desulfuromonadales bacterium]
MKYLLPIMFIICLLTSGPAQAAGVVTVLKTGQTATYAAGDDGALQKGLAWPVPRFVDNGDQSVTDKLTNQIWSKDGNAPGPVACGPAVTKTWQGALDYVKCLNSNSYLGRTDWRLPNSAELLSLVNFGQSSSAGRLNTQGVSNVQADVYWSSSTYANITYNAWCISMIYGFVNYDYKTFHSYVWPVRGGQSGSFGSFTLTTAKTGTGSGAITSNPTGISCGTTCCTGSFIA